MNSNIDHAPPDGSYDNASGGGEINLLNGKNYRAGQPHHQFDWLRRNRRLYKHRLPNDGEFWAVTRHDDVAEINRDYQRFSSTAGVIFFNHGYPLEPQGEQGDDITGPADMQEPDEEACRRSMMILKDPPEHTRYRKLLSKDFARGAAGHWRARVQEIAREVVDAVIARGECEFVSEISGEFAARVIADIMGLPPADGRLLYSFTEVYHAVPGTLPQAETDRRITQMKTYVDKVIKQKRRARRDDIASKLLSGVIGGATMDEADFFEQFMLMINGGTDTARNLLAVGLLELLARPAQMAWLMEDPNARMASAREEMLRWISPVVYQCRSATRDFEFRGEQIKRGDLFAMYYGAANRDPAVFDNPHELNLARENNCHLAFGGGHHICLGQWIARTEIDVMLTELLSRMKNIALLGEVEWLESNFLFGLRKMHIRFDSV